MYDAKTKKSCLRRLCHSEHSKSFAFWEGDRPQVVHSRRNVFSPIKMEFQRKNFSEKSKTQLQRPLQTKQKNQEGFSLIVVLTLTPLFITALAYLSALSLSLSQYHKGHQLCHRQLLETQNQFILIIKKLMLLNPRARALRTERRQAEKKLKLAQYSANPKAIAIAQGRLFAVISKQMRHRSKQQKLVSLAHRVQIVARKEFSNLVRLKFKNSVIALEPPKYKFAIKATPLHSLTPDYLPPRNFENKQKASGKWKLDFKSILPPWLSHFVSTDQTLTFQCAATIFRKENQWTPSLSADKSLLSF